jgi:ribonuclease HI
VGEEVPVVKNGQWMDNKERLLDGVIREPSRRAAKCFFPQLRCLFEDAGLPLGSLWTSVYGFLPRERCASAAPPVSRRHRVAMVIIALQHDIEPNPGPTSRPAPKRRNPRYLCSNCKLGVERGSIQCTACAEWVHNACTGIPARDLRKVAPTYVCRPCCALYPCSHCGEGVGGASIQCMSCSLWVHDRCLHGTPSLLFTCDRCTSREPPPAAQNPDMTLPAASGACSSPLPCPPQTRNVRHRQDRLRTWRLGKAGQRKERTITILQCNVDGLTESKQAELQAVADDPDHPVTVILVQETKLKKSSPLPALAGFDIIRCDRTMARGQGEVIGGGVAIFVRQGLKYARKTKPPPTATADKYTEWCAVEIQTPSGPVSIFNLYRPPIRPSARDRRQDNFSSDALPSGSRTIVCGDLNAHHPAWDSLGTPDTAGEDLADWLDSVNMTVLNDPDVPTHTLRSSGSRSSPDISLCSDDLTASWSTKYPIGRSDHDTIFIGLQISPALIAPPRISLRPNFRKANWDLFQAHINGALEGVAYPLLGDLIHVILTASRDAIPVRRPRKRPPRPWYDDECRAVVRDKNLAARRANESEEARRAWVECCRIAEETLQAKKQAHWRATTSNFDARTRPGEIFRCMQRMDGRAPTSPSTAGIHLPTGKVVHGKDKAEAYAKLYTSLSRLPPHLRHSKRDIVRENRRRLNASLNSSDTTPMVPFSREELLAALRCLPTDKAAGQDGAYAELLQHLPPRALTILECELSRMVASGIAPAAWRRATVIPILKKGKAPEDLASYRPVSLTSCVAKLTERLLLRRLRPTLDDLLADEQGGFRQHRSCEDQIAKLAQDIYDDWDAREGRKSVLVCLDFAKAFDTVPHHLLIRQLLDDGIPPYMTLWISNFLRDRRIQVRFDGMSRMHRASNGLPQGAVLSPALFTLYINPLIKSIKGLPYVHPTAFADDLAIRASHNDLKVAEHRLQPALDLVNSWSYAHGLNLSAPKCTSTVFTLNSREAGYEVSLNIGGTPVPHLSTPVFLGITLDRTLTFRPHVDSLAARLGSRLQALKALSGRTWGQEESTLRMMYTATVQSTIGYGSGTYASFAKPTTLDVMNRCINRGARIITGLHKATPVGPLRAEAGVPTIEEIGYCRAAAQLERAARVQGHPLAEFARNAPVPRRLTKSCFVDRAKDIVRDCGLDEYPREPLPPPEPPPRYNTEAVSFHIASLGKSVSDSDRRAHAETFIQSLEPTDGHLWTDGGAEGGTENGGAGGIFTARNGSRTFARPAGRFCSSFRAEMIALKNGLDLALRYKDQFSALRVCTDSLSALQQLERGPLLQPCSKGRYIWSLISRLDCPVQMVHVPSHVGLEGNETADRQAAAGSEAAQSEVPIDLPTARAVIGRETRLHFKTITRRGPQSGSAKRYWLHARPIALSRTLPRRLQTGIRRVRSNHFIGTAEYRHRIGIRGTESDKCEDCGSVDTVDHLLLDCPRWYYARARHFGTGNPTLEVLNDPEALASYLEETGRIPA